MVPALIFHLLSVTLVIILLTCAFTAGSWILERTGCEWGPAERLVLSIPLGCGAIATIILAFGAIGLLHGAALWAAVLVPGIASWRQLPRITAGLREALPMLKGWSALSGSLTRVIACAVVLLLLLGALPPTTDWDSLMYHLEVPGEFLKAGRILVPQDNLHVAFVGLWHMLYLPFLVIGSSIAPALLNAACALLLGIAVLVIGARLFGRSAAVLAFVALWGSSGIILVSATPRIDVVLAYCLLLVTYVLISAAEERRPEKLVTAAMLGGVALGMKYHALLFLAALLPVAVWAVSRASAKNSERLRLLGWCALVAILTALPWLVKNWLLLGAPLYPLLAERLLPPWLAELSGGSNLPAGIPPETFRVLAQAREPFSLMKLLFAPASLTVEAEARAFTISPALLLLPLGLLYARCMKLTMLLVPAVGYVVLLTVASEFINLRYLLPAIAPLMLVIAESARRFGATFFAEHQWRDIALIAAIGSLFPAAQAFNAELMQTPRIGAALGTVAESEYLRNSRVSGFSSYYSATRWLDSHTRPEDQVLLLFEARGYYFDREVIQDNDLTNWPLLLATGAPQQCLQGSRITHVLVNHGAAAYYRNRGSDLSHLGWNAFPEFAARCLEQVNARGGYVLLRVRTPAPRGGA